MSKTIYLIDFENVHEAGLEGMSACSADCSIHLFYSINANKLSLDWLRGLKASLTVHKVSPGRQSLDMQLVSYLGYLIGAEGPDCRYVIVSKDTDYANTPQFWQEEMGISVIRQQTIDGADIPVPAPAPRSRSGRGGRGRRPSAGRMGAISRELPADEATETAAAENAAAAETADSAVPAPASEEKPSAEIPAEPHAAPETDSATPAGEAAAQADKADKAPAESAAAPLEQPAEQKSPAFQAGLKAAAEAEHKKAPVPGSDAHHSSHRNGRQAPAQTVTREKISQPAPADTQPTGIRFGRISSPAREFGVAAPKPAEEILISTAPMTATAAEAKPAAEASNATASEAETKAEIVSIVEQAESSAPAPVASTAETADAPVHKPAAEAAEAIPVPETDAEKLTAAEDTASTSKLAESKEPSPSEEAEPAPVQEGSAAAGQTTSAPAEPTAAAETEAAAPQAAEVPVKQPSRRPNSRRRTNRRPAAKPAAEADKQSAQNAPMKEGFSEQPASKATAKPEAAQKPATKAPAPAQGSKTRLNNGLMKALSDKKVENETTRKIVALTMAHYGDNAIKQLAYRAIVKEFGQKQGLELYNYIKPVLNEKQK